MVRPASAKQPWRIVANHTRAHFGSLNAVLAGVKDLRMEVDAAKQRLERHGLRSILFIDEVHRFGGANRPLCCPGWKTER